MTGSPGDECASQKIALRDIHSPRAAYIRKRSVMTLKQLCVIACSERGKAKLGDILVGYSEASGDQYPSIYLAGRQVNDPLGLGKLEAEVEVEAGLGSQAAPTNRWGDYSAMRIDQDGCTFWYATEYYTHTQPIGWSTQIASATFSSCH